MGEEIEIRLAQGDKATEHDDHGTCRVAAPAEGAGQHMVDTVEEQEIHIDTEEKSS